ncbi:MAG: PIN domain-containing protein [Candidatus Hadarchaeum sp.]|uniref:PIN domain-containing protein n=1 Tax=Candidatus Hadarchaeum sp. TaxID=2883567 RepID=UPI003D14F0D9
MKLWEKGEGKVREALELLLGIPNVRFLAPDVEIAAEDARLRASYGLRTPDALLFATARAAGATAFLTNDRAFLRVKEGPEGSFLTASSPKLSDFLDCGLVFSDF